MVAQRAGFSRTPRGDEAVAGADAGDRIVSVAAACVVTGSLRRFERAGWVADERSEAGGERGGESRIGRTRVETLGLLEQ
jgi:hypothetical protein